MRDWPAFVREHLRLADLRPEREARVVRELAAQLEDFYRDAMARGLSESDADVYASAQIKDWTRLADDVRRADRAQMQSPTERLATHLEARPSSRRGALMLAQALRDARYGIRQLLKAPGFSVVAILTLALGIGATTCMFSIVNGVLLRPLPYPAGDRLVRVHEVVPQFGLFSVAPANFLDWRKQATAFSHVAAYGSSSVTIAGADGPERIPSTTATADLFPTLGVTPLLGSAFTAAQDAPGAPATIVLSYGAWQRRFGGDPAIVGRTITVNNAPATVIGVMPAGFYYPTPASEFWTPLGLDPANATRGGHFLGVVARLKDGISVEQAGAEMKGLAESLARQYPNNSAGESAKVVLLQEQWVGAVRPALLTLLAAVGVVILVVCANVANLLLVRASTREREIAVRVALGASRLRLVLQMLSESLVLAGSGGILGVLFAYGSLPQILRLAGTSIPRANDVAIDGRVLAFAAAASIVTGVLFGLAPAWQASRERVSGALKDSGRGSTAASGRWIRRVLMVAEVGLSIVLLTGATLLLRSFDRLTSVDPGFKPERVLAFQVSLPRAAYPREEQTAALFSSLVENLEAQPGVQSVGVTQTIPMRGSYSLAFDIRGRAPTRPGEGPSANYRAVSPHYFDALGVPVIEGRAFSTHDLAGAEPVAIVDRAFARKYFPDGDPIGQGLHIGNGGPDTKYCTVVGVVGDMHYGGLDATVEPTMYAPFTQDPFSTMWVLAKTDGEPAAIAGAARQTLRQLDARLPVYSMNPMATIVSDSVAQRRFSMLLLAVFAALTLFLAAVGLYGVVAYSVTQRTREIGLRMALGAEPAGVVRMVVGDGMTLAVVGVVAGVAGAIGLARFIQTLLFEIPPSDPVSYAFTSLLLLAVSAVACYLPARRAMRVDPMIALQAE